jgi:UTP--glucose-1-phosphate uridylyltransferase
MGKEIKKVRKAIVPVAGLGTRFLPYTKAIPKEMLPIINKPTIQYIVDEAIASGIEEIIFITAQGKDAVVDHFDRDLYLEQQLFNKGKNELITELQEISKVRIFTVRQYEQKGLGHAVLQAKTFIGDEPFALLLGDDVIYNPAKPALRQLIDVYEEKGGSVLGVQEVPMEKVSAYGVIDPAEKLDDNT